MFKILKTLVLFTLILKASPYDATSLVSLDIGSGTLDMQNSSLNQNRDTDINPIAIKLGAKSDSMRVYFEAKIYNAEDFKYSNSFGITLQFLHKINNSLSYFIGPTTGKINLEFDSQEGIREVSTSYFGLDTGLLINLSEKVDFDVGYKYLSIDVQNQRDSIVYNINNLNYIYVSFIYKFQL